MRKTKKPEKECKHLWASLLAKYKGKIVSAPTKVCLKCGEIKIGEHTVKISRFRLSIEGGTKLKIPVGTNMYN
jgi:hypothetical protein